MGYFRNIIDFKYGFYSNLSPLSRGIHHFEIALLEVGQNNERSQGNF